MELRIGSKTTTLGLRWFSAESVAKLPMSNKERFNSNRILVLEKKKRACVGMIEDSLTTSKPTYAGAAIISKDMQKGVSILRIDPESQAGIENPKWWLVVSVDGFPVLDMVSETLQQLFEPLVSLLGDSVISPLRETSAVFQTNLHPSEDFEDGSHKDLIELINEIESVAESNFNFTEFEWSTYRELVFSARKEFVTKIAKPNTLQTYFTVEGITEKLVSLSSTERMALYAIGLVVFFGVWYLVKYIKTIDEVAVVDFIPPVIEEKPVVDTPITKGRRLISETLSGVLLGDSATWVNPVVGRYGSLPNFKHGYIKESLECRLATGLCYVTFKSSGDIADFGEAMNYYEKLFDETVFTSDASTIVGNFSIAKDSLFLAKTDIQVKDLPAFDGGRSLLERSLPINQRRPGLNISIGSAEKVSVTPSDKSFSMPDELINEFVVVGWSSSGEYLHQLDLILSSVVRPFITVSSLKIKGRGEFKVSGGYVMRGDG